MSFTNHHRQVLSLSSTKKLGSPGAYLYPSSPYVCTSPLTSEPKGFSSAILRGCKSTWPMMACSSVTDVKFKLKLPQCQKEFASSAALELREYQDWGSLFVSEKDHAWQKLPASSGPSGLYQGTSSAWKGGRGEKLSQLYRDWSTNIFCRLLMLTRSQGLRLPKKQV